MMRRWKQLQRALPATELEAVRKQIKEYKLRAKELQHLTQVDWSNPGNF